MTKIDVSAFSECQNLKSITFSNQLATIGKYAFSKCESLKQIIIPRSVTKIETSPFFGCKSLENIEVENGNKVYDSRNNCNAIIETASNKLLCGIKGTVIPQGITTIGEKAFYSSSVKDIFIPKSVNNIEYYAFASSELESIKFESATPPATHNNAFITSSYETATIYIPKGSLAAYKAATVWSIFKNIKEYETTEIEDVILMDIVVKISENCVSLSGCNGFAVAIYSANGMFVDKIQNYSGEEISLEQGVYILSIGNRTIKVRV